MKRINRKKTILAVCITIPLVTAVAFLPKVVKAMKRRKYAGI